MQQQQQQNNTFKRPPPISTANIKKPPSSRRRSSSSSSSSTSVRRRQRTKQQQSQQQQQQHTKKFDERQFILRVPEHVADVIRQSIREQDNTMTMMKKRSSKSRRSSGSRGNNNDGNGSDDDDDDDDDGEHSAGTPVPSSDGGGGGGGGMPIEGMRIEFSANDPLARQGKIVFPEAMISKHSENPPLRREYAFELVDLPAIVEAYKSLDMMTYYKSGDVGQMFLVKDEPPSSLHASDGQQQYVGAIPSFISRRSGKVDDEDEDEDEEEDPDEKERREYYEMERKLARFQYPHGLTPSMRDIRRNWENQEMNVSRRDIDKLVQEFERMMEEEDQANVEIEIFSETEDEADEDEDAQSAIVTRTARMLESEMDSVASSSDAGERMSASRARLYSEMDDDDQSVDDDISEFSDRSLSLSGQLMRAVQEEGGEETVSMSSFDDELTSETTGTETFEVTSPSAVPISATQQEEELMREYQSLASEKSALESRVSNLFAEINKAKSDADRAPIAHIKAQYQKKVDELQARLTREQAQLRTIDTRMRELRS